MLEKQYSILSEKIFEISSPDEFKNLALEIFLFQYQHNKIYRQFVDLLGVKVNHVIDVEQIPFLPIEFFKNYDVLNSVIRPEIVFLSSGTSGMSQSRHLVSDVKIYEKSYLKAFEMFYGTCDSYCILALLPSYLERKGSSLVYMVEDLIERTQNSSSGFYLNNITALIEKLKDLKSKKIKTILIGVSYALLDLADQINFKIPEVIIMETGGMKGRRKEMIREELHGYLKKSFGVSVIHSEYGMTELLSQAYSSGQGIFNTPPWMRILTRDTSDALQILNCNETGGINVIDLANINSCSFIATQDLGKVYADGSFEIIGRFDNSDIRGCNLMVSL